MKKFVLILLMSTLFILTACGEQLQEKNETKDEVSKETGNDHINTEVVEALKQFPDEKADKIITTSVPIAEMLHTLHITPVGVPTSTNPLPKDFEQISQIGSPMAPDLEKITSLQSDLIIGSKALKDSFEKSVEGMDVNRVYLPTDSLEDLKLSFETLGTYFDKKEEMNKVLTTIEEKEQELKNKAEGKELPTVMLMIGTGDSFMVMSEQSYLGSLISRLGAENIAETELKVKDTYSPINLENIVEIDPDVIFVLSSLDHGASEDMFEKEVEKNGAWKKLSAYENSKIHMLDYSTFGVTSINNVEKALTELADYFN